MSEDNGSTPERATSTFTLRNGAGIFIQNMPGNVTINVTDPADAAAKRDRLRKLRTLATSGSTEAERALAGSRAEALAGRIPPENTIVVRIAGPRSLVESIQRYNVGALLELMCDRDKGKNEEGVEIVIDVPPETKLDIHDRFAGDYHVGDTLGEINATLSGAAGELVCGAVGRASMYLQGSSRVRLASVTGSELQVTASGRAQCTVATGRTRMLNASVSNAASVVYCGTTEYAILTAYSGGTGTIDVHHVTRSVSPIGALSRIKITHQPRPA